MAEGGKNVVATNTSNDDDDMAPTEAVGCKDMVKHAKLVQTAYSLTEGKQFVPDYMVNKMTAIIGSKPKEV